MDGAIYSSTVTNSGPLSQSTDKHSIYPSAEALTDQLLLRPYDVLDDAASAAFLAGTKAIGAALGV